MLACFQTIPDSSTELRISYPPPAFKIHEIPPAHKAADNAWSQLIASSLLPHRYRWEHFGRIVSEVGPELHISRISREEAGTYIVMASSPRGSINTTFTLDVLCECKQVMLLILEFLCFSRILINNYYNNNDVF